MKGKKLKFAQEIAQQLETKSNCFFVAIDGPVPEVHKNFGLVTGGDVVSLYHSDDVFILFCAFITSLQNDPEMKRAFNDAVRAVNSRVSFSDPDQPNTITKL